MKPVSLVPHASQQSAQNWPRRRRSHHSLGLREGATNSLYISGWLNSYITLFLRLSLLLISVNSGVNRICMNSRRKSVWSKSGMDWRSQHSLFFPCMHDDWLSVRRHCFGAECLHGHTHVHPHVFTPQHGQVSTPVT